MDRILFSMTGLSSEARESIIAMAIQKQLFKATEADQWFLRFSDQFYLRSKEKEEACDNLIEIFKSIGLIPKDTLEIGCSFDYLLNAINKVFGSKCSGIDPSRKAIEYGQNNFPDISLQVGTADKLPFEDNSFDLIIFGFCLYLCDRKDLFLIASEADRCLKNNAYLVIMDFYPPFPYKNRYSHCEGVYSYKMNYAEMFKWNPYYQDVWLSGYNHDRFNMDVHPDEKVAVNILKKNDQYGYPTEPFDRIREQRKENTD